ncbi:MAG: protein translocase subunit SecD [Chloroflexi bacterium]|nr:protein translocase subunit SecD [Chloroflexota bacterium]
MPGRTLTTLIGIILLALAALWVDFPDNPGLNLRLGDVVIQREIALRQGLDLQGGLQVLLEADLPPDQPLPPGTLETARRIIEDRVNGLGVSEPLIQLQGERRIIVELPGLSDPDRAIATFGQTGLLEFIHAGQVFLPEGTPVVTTGSATSEVSPTPTVEPQATPLASPTPEEPVYRTILLGRNLTSADLNTNPLGQIEINFTLDSEGTRLFADYTRENVGQVMCIVLDKVVVSCATIADTIPTGQVQLTRQGGFTPEEANSIVIRLRYGQLPIPLRIETNRTVGPTLGEDSIQRSRLAGVIGLTLVVLFMLLYYRLPGFLADVALATYALVVLALFKLVPVVLTLAGIAGFILSIGMAVDANILIFERLKEELRAGKSLRLAIEAGFNRAWPSIRDSNLSTLITCGVLFWFGSTFGASVVKGFALTLAIGVLASMFTAIVVTRTFLRLIMEMDLVHDPRWFGI